MLNACLTVPAGQANGHAGQIWEPFTDAVIKVVNELEEPVVFILWGSYARKKKPLITQDVYKRQLFTNLVERKLSFLSTKCRNLKSPWDLP